MRLSASFVSFFLYHGHDNTAEPPAAVCPESGEKRQLVKVFRRLVRLDDRDLRRCDGGEDLKKLVKHILVADDEMKEFLVRMSPGFDLVAAVLQKTLPHRLGRPAGYYLLDCTRNLQRKIK